MRKPLSLALLVVLGLSQGSGVSAASGALDQRLVRATSVAIGFEVHLDFTNQAPSPDDRDALNAVRYEMARWRRYWIVSDRRSADLLIAIRVRGDLSPRIGGSIRRDGLTFRGEGTANGPDTLTVYDPRHGSALGLPVWRGESAGGLSGDRPQLLRDLRAAVESLDKEAIARLRRP